MTTITDVRIALVDLYCEDEVSHTAYRRLYDMLLDLEGLEYAPVDPATDDARVF